MGRAEGLLDVQVAFRVPRHGSYDHRFHSGTIGSHQAEAPGLQGCGPDQEIRPYCWRWTLGSLLSLKYVRVWRGRGGRGIVGTRTTVVGGEPAAPLRRTKH